MFIEYTGCSFSPPRSEMEVEAYFVKSAPQFTHCFLDGSSNFQPLAWFLREAERKNEEVYEKLPLFEIKQKYGKTDAGKYLVSKQLSWLDVNYFHLLSQLVQIGMTTPCVHVFSMQGLCGTDRS